MFDFLKETKEKYFARAEKYIEENQMNGFRIDRDQIAINNSEHIVKIFFIPFYPKVVSKKALEHAKKLDKVVITNDRFTPRKKGESASMRENGYILLDMDEEDW